MAFAADVCFRLDLLTLSAFTYRRVYLDDNYRLERAKIRVATCRLYIRRNDSRQYYQPVFSE